MTQFMTTAILAQVGLQDATGFGAWILYLIALLVGVNVVVSIWRGLRRNPPLDRELTTFATKTDLQTYKDENGERFNGISRKIDSVRTELRADLREAENKNATRDRGLDATLQNIFRALGDLEGTVKKFMNSGTRHGE